MPAVTICIFLGFCFAHLRPRKILLDKQLHCLAKDHHITSIKRRSTELLRHRGDLHGSRKITGACRAVSGKGSKPGKKFGSFFYDGGGWHKAALLKCPNRLGSLSFLHSL